MSNVLFERVFYKRHSSDQVARPGEQNILSHERGLELDYDSPDALSQKRGNMSRSDNATSDPMTMTLCAAIVQAWLPVRDAATMRVRPTILPLSKLVKCGSRV